MEKTHDENRCENCARAGGNDVRNLLTGLRTCFAGNAQDGDIVCMNFVEKEEK